MSTILALSLGGGHAVGLESFLATVNFTGREYILVGELFTLNITRA